MVQDEYDKVELPAIEQLQQLGWDYVHGSKLGPESTERAYLRDVVLVKRLEAAIQRINPWISDENLRKVMREITHPNFAGLIEFNQTLWEIMCCTGDSAISVDQDLGKGRKGQTVKIIDFDHPENNEFLCTNQFKVEGVNQNIIPDIVCFVNGLPLAVIECKSPYISSPMQEGIKQLRRYANLRDPQENEGAQKLFWYNQLMVSTCRDITKVGTISSSAQHYSDWKDAYPFTDSDLMNLGRPANEVRDVPAAAYMVNAKNLAGASAVTAQQRLLAGMFSRDNFLDILQNFVIFEPVEGRLIKKVARYQQFRAVNKVIDRIKTGKDRKEKSGVIWHTQGSGKSLTMVMLAVKMRRDPELKQYKLVFITDRTQLDLQLSTTFRNTQGETV
ncbi:MAG: type I restriction endonuclease, partial [Colwellia sp.]